MKGLLMKDLYCIRGYFKQLAFVLVFLTAMSVLMKSPALVSYMLVFMSMSLVQSCMIIDERNKWERYALTLPIRRRDVVKGKYVLLLLMSGGAGVLATLINALLCAAFDTNLMEAVISTAAVIVIYLYAFSFALPATFRLGADKARYILMTVIVVPALGIGAAAKLFPQLGRLQPTDTQIVVACVSAVVLGAALFYLSYRVSLRIYSRKEF